jgi:hypothetical protein
MLHLMTKRAWLILLGATAAAAPALWLAWPAPEPSYNGHTLSYWVRSYNSPAPRRLDEPADAAVRQIGTNAIPSLLCWVRYREPAWRYHLYQLATRLLHRDFGLRRTTGREQLALKSCRAFRALGTNALVAMPALVELMHNTNAPAAAEHAIACLAALSTNGLPPLLSVIDDVRLGPKRSEAVFYIQMFQPKAASITAVAPVFLRFIADPTADLN